MCRWAAYLGRDVFLEDIVTAPCHSLIAQSHCAQEAKSPTNGDGFGLAWYGDRPEPGLYRDILPAWSDPNLISLCRQIRSGLFLAHIRASTGGATSRANCHPFVSGRWSFIHNGQIGGFERIRRSLENTIADRTLRPETGHDRFRAVLPSDARRRTGCRSARRPCARYRSGDRSFASRRHRTGGQTYRSLFRRNLALCGPLCHGRACANPLYVRNRRRERTLHRLGAVRSRRRYLDCHSERELRRDIEGIDDHPTFCAKRQ